MNISTLKINSFCNENKILIDGTPVSMNSVFMNYYNKPIITVARKIVETMGAQYNDYFSVKVFGNKFECALMNLICKENKLCSSFESFPTEITIPTSSRLSLLEKITSSKINISFCVDADREDILFPSYPNVDFVAGESTAVVSDNMNFITGCLSPSIKVAFLIDGESTILGNTFIIGCKYDEFRELFFSYIDTCFINPEINKLVNINSDKVTDETILVNRCEPYFHFSQMGPMQFGEKINPNIKCVPEDADKSKLYFKSEGSGIRLYKNNQIEAIEQGKSSLFMFYDSPVAIDKISILTEKHCYAQSISIEIISEKKEVCAGKEYKIITAVSPSEAEDRNQIVCMTSDSEIAEVKDNMLYVKKPGIFELVAKTPFCSQSKKIVAKPPVEKIILSEIPNEIYLGDMFDVNVTVIPSDAYDSRYKWICSPKEVAVVGKNNTGKELIKCTAIGTANIKCVSIANPDVYATLEFPVSSTLNKNEKNSAFYSIGIIASLISILLAFVQGHSCWIAFALAVVMFVLSMKDPQNKKKGIIFIGITLLCSILGILLPILM